MRFRAGPFTLSGGVSKTLLAAVAIGFLVLCCCGVAVALLS